MTKLQPTDLTRWWQARSQVGQVEPAILGKTCACVNVIGPRDSPSCFACGACQMSVKRLPVVCVSSGLETNRCSAGWIEARDDQAPVHMLF